MVSSEEKKPFVFFVTLYMKKPVYKVFQKNKKNNQDSKRQNLSYNGFNVLKYCLQNLLKATISAFLGS